MHRFDTAQALEISMRTVRLTHTVKIVYIIHLNLYSEL